jgi:hypothetical protein
MRSIHFACHAARMRSIQKKSGSAEKDGKDPFQLIEDPSIPVGCCAFAKHDKGWTGHVTFIWMLRIRAA